MIALPRGNRTLKGNRRRAVFDRLIVPVNGHVLPVDPTRPVVIEQPTEPVGQRVKIKNVLLYEISKTYEGTSQKNVMTVPFDAIVGNPITDANLAKGTTVTTSQGETIILKWVISNDRKKQGLALINLRATGTSWYEPNWGNIYGVGLEWISCDGAMSGTIWANRHLGSSTVTIKADGTLDITTSYSGSDDPAFSAYCIRPGLMLGNPEPDRTLFLMGQGLPLRVFPALGKLGQGTFFGFNVNVMDFLYIKPPTLPTISESGIADVRSGDYVGVRWQKDEFTPKVYVGMRFISGAQYVKRINPNGVPVAPVNGTIYRFSADSAAMTGNASSVNGAWDTSSFTAQVQFLLLDSSDDTILACSMSTIDFTSGSSAMVTRESCPVDPPKDMCGGETVPSDGGDDGQPPVIPESGYKYFCDSTVPTSSVDTSYWVGDKALEPSFQQALESQYGVAFDTKFWEGRDGWLALFNKLNPSEGYSKSRFAKQPFHTFLYKMVSGLVDGTGDVMEVTSWPDFKMYCNTNGLTCLTDLQKASMFMSYQLRVPVNFFSSAAGFLDGDTLDGIYRSLQLLPSGIYDWIDFNDVQVDPSVAAFAADIPDIRLKALSSFVNFEPSALTAGIDNAIGHRPSDYLKPSGSQWGSVTAVDYSSYNLPEMTDTNFKAYVAAEIGIHEIGHSVAYHGLDVYGTVLHEMTEWLSISGWSANAPQASPDNVATHLVKTRTSAQTGGMPKTDAGKEAPVSQYGCFHPAEDFAEAYRMYIINPVFLEEKHPLKYAFMISKVEPMFQGGI